MTADPQTITLKLEVDGDVEQALRRIVREEIAADKARAEAAGTAFREDYYRRFPNRRPDLTPEGNPA